MSGFTNVVKLSKVRRKHLADVAKIKTLRSECFLRYIALARAGLPGHFHDHVEIAEKMLVWWERGEYPNYAALRLLEVTSEHLADAEKQPVAK